MYYLVLLEQLGIPLVDLYIRLGKFFLPLPADKPTMLDELNKFELKQPEIVFEWKDSETEAEGWVVINSLRGGASGGGTRMRKGLDKHEVESLAKTMEVKFTISGPQIGG